MVKSDVVNRNITIFFKRISHYVHSIDLDTSTKQYLLVSIIKLGSSNVVADNQFAQFKKLCNLLETRISKEEIITRVSEMI